MISEACVHKMRDIHIIITCISQSFTNTIMHLSMFSPTRGRVGTPTAFDIFFVFFLSIAPAVEHYKTVNFDLCVINIINKAGNLNL